MHPPRIVLDNFCTGNLIFRDRHDVLGENDVVMDTREVLLYPQGRGGC